MAAAQQRVDEASESEASQELGSRGSVANAKAGLAAAEAADAAAKANALDLAPSRSATFEEQLRERLGAAAECRVCCYGEVSHLTRCCGAMLCAGCASSDAEFADCAVCRKSGCAVLATPHEPPVNSGRYHLYKLEGGGFRAIEEDFAGVRSVRMAPSDVEIKFQAPHAFDAMLFHRRDGLPVAMSARWRGGIPTHWLSSAQGVLERAAERGIGSVRVSDASGVTQMFVGLIEQGLAEDIITPTTFEEEARRARGRDRIVHNAAAVDIWNILGAEDAGFSESKELARLPTKHGDYAPIATAAATVRSEGGFYVKSSVDGAKRVSNLYAHVAAFVVRYEVTTRASYPAIRGAAAEALAADPHVFLAVSLCDPVIYPELAAKLNEPFFCLPDEVVATFLGGGDVVGMLAAWDVAKIPP